MIELTWTAESKYWLDEIHDYIAEDNEIAAERVVDGIFEKAQYLIQFPQLGSALDKKKYPDNVRCLLYRGRSRQPYRIVYLIKPDQNIDILGVYHGSLNIEDHFDIDRF